MKNFLRLLSFLRPATKAITLSILAGLATIGAGVGMLSTSAFLIASAALHPSIAELQVAIVGVRFFGISRGVFRYAERLVSHSANLKILSEIRVWFYKTLEPLAPARLMGENSGDLLQRAMGDIETLENFYVRFVMPVIVALISGAAVSWFAGTIYPPLSLVLAAGLLLNGLVLPALSMLLSKGNARLLVQSRAEASRGMVEWVQGLGDWQVFGVAQSLLNRMREKADAHTDFVFRNSVQTSLFDGVTLMITQLTILLGIWVMIPAVSQGSLSGVSLAVVALLISASFEATAPLPLAAQQLNASLAAAGRIFKLVEPGKGQGSGVEQRGGLLPEVPVRLEIQKVTFQYTEDTPEIVRDFSLHLERGQTIAVVGPSGAGKSTLVQLLLRFWQPQRGTILLDGTNIIDLDEEWLRKQFGGVSPATMIFNLSLRENLLLAREGANDQALLSAINSAGLKDWFDSLPSGLDTFLGEQGAFLSAGERQRIAAARVLLQAPPFLLLDEPVAHLDGLTGQSILKQLLNMTPPPGVLYITHDLLSLGEMDEILLLEGGEVVERGNFAHLLAKGGKFAGLVETQQNFLETAK